MARRKKNTTADDFIELVALLPWWAGLGLALISYIILHGLAAPAAVLATRPDQVAQVVTSTVWRTLAYAGQFLVPLFCVVGAFISVLRRRKRTALFHNATSSDSATALDGISWREFEMLVGEGYRQLGYRVVEGAGGAGGADGGVDLRLQKAGEKFLVQCKQWKAFKVGVQVVRELYGVMAAEGAAGGMVVTSGRFTDEARAFAAGRNVELVDGAALKLLLERARRSVKPSSAPAESPIPSASSTTSSQPTCPLCQGAMTRRTAKRGANAGNAFWGCTRFPACKGTQA